MPRILVKPDTLDEENPKFGQSRLKQPVFLNSVPKSGSHLLRNIIRMFVPVDQQYQAQFIQHAILDDHVEAFDADKPMLSWGHLLYSDASAIETSTARVINLVRDPYDWVLARTRFFLSDEFKGNADHLKDGSLTIEKLLNLMIFGIFRKTPSMAEIYNFNAAAWVGTGAHFVRYEDIIAHLKKLESDEAEAFFTDLFGKCGIDPVPADWRERVLVGSDRNQSGTARENLTGLDIEIPAVLPDAQKALVDYAVPGLRALLGYK
jgi:hypothetical protein